MHQTLLFSQITSELAHHNSAFKLQQKYHKLRVWYFLKNSLLLSSCLVQHCSQVVALGFNLNVNQINRITLNKLIEHFMISLDPSSSDI